MLMMLIGTHPLPTKIEIQQVPVVTNRNWELVLEKPGKEGFRGGRRILGFIERGNQTLDDTNIFHEAVI